VADEWNVKVEISIMKREQYVTDTIKTKVYWGSNVLTKKQIAGFWGDKSGMNMSLLFPRLLWTVFKV
jgi:hypothetical protein